MRKPKQYKNYKDIPVPKPGQIVIMPQDERLMENPPFVNNHKTVPEWFKGIPKDRGSIRRCAGTIDYLSLGVTVPFWTNAFFEPNMQAPGRWNLFMENYPNGQPFINQPFPFDSTGRCPMTSVRDVEDSFYPKLVNPYHVRTAPGWSTILLPPLFEPNPNYVTMPSVIHTDVYHTLNLVINITTSSSFSIKYGTPVMHLIPFKRNSDFEEIIGLTSEAHIIGASRGFVSGTSMPSQGTSAPYRRFVKRVDEEMSKEPQKRFFFRRK